MKVCVDRTRSALTDAIASDTRKKNLKKFYHTNDSIASSTGTSTCDNDFNSDPEDSKPAAITPTNEKKESTEKKDSVSSTYLSSDDSESLL